MNVFRHRHEVESGRTSSISRHILGFDRDGLRLSSDEFAGGWTGVIEKSSKVLTFIDVAGHENYFKTTLVALLGQVPDYGCVVIAAPTGVMKMTREHLGVGFALRIPIFVVVTKVDACPPAALKQTIEQLAEVLEKPDVNRVPFVIENAVGVWVDGAVCCVCVCGWVWV